MKKIFFTFFNFSFFRFFLSGHSIRMVNLTRKKNCTNTRKRGILRLLSAPARYIKRKVKSIYRKLVKKQQQKTTKGPNISENEVNSVEKL